MVARPQTIALSVFALLVVAPVATSGQQRGGLADPEAIASRPLGSATAAQVSPSDKPVATVEVQPRASTRKPIPVMAPGAMTPIRVQPGGNAPARVSGPPVAPASPAMAAGSAALPSCLLPQIRIGYPSTVNLNVPARVELHATCPGETDTASARLIVELPAHLELVGSTPAAERCADGCVCFELPSIGAGDELPLSLEVIAREKKPMEVRTRLEVTQRQQIALDVRQPVLAVALEGRGPAILGQPGAMELVIRNTGDGMADGLAIDLQLPAGCAADASLAGILAETKNLAPGAEARFPVNTVWASDGMQTVRATARAAGAEDAAHTLDLSVIRPELELAVSAPAETWVNSRTWYSLVVSNPSSIAMEDVVVTLHLPTLEVQTISTEADFDDATKTLTWQVGKLDAAAKAEFVLVAMPSTAGAHAVDASVESRLTARKELTVDTRALARADVRISLQQLEYPAPVGVGSGYRLVVENRGTEAATDAKLTVDLPAGWTMEGQTARLGAASQVFELGQLEPGQTRELEFAARGTLAGEHAVRTSLSHAGAPQGTASSHPVTLFQSDTVRVAERAEPRMGGK